MEFEERRPATPPGADEPRLPWWRTTLERLTSKEFYILGLVTLGMLFVYLNAGSKSGANQGIWDIDYARGLITLLFSVGTIVIAVVLILTAVFNDEDDAKAEARFSRAKEVLTLLIGVFGTIVGFYFGSATRGPGDGRPAGETPAAIQAAGGVSKGDVVIMDGPYVRDSNLPSLLSSPNTVGIVFDGSLITDAGLDYLKDMKKLRWISIRGVRGVTEKGLAELKKSIPELTAIQ